MPVLVLGAAYGLGERPIKSMEAVAKNVRSSIIKDCGHFVPQEQPTIPN